MGRLGGALLALATAFAAQGARAQDGLIVSAAIPQGVDRGRNLSVAQRLRPAYTPSGARIGGLMIFPRLRTAAGGTSNSYLAPSNGRPSAFVSLAPAVEVASLWSRHALRLQAEALDRRYLNESRRNERTWTLAGEGELELGATLRATPRLAASQQVEGPLSGEVDAAQAAVSRFRRDLASVRVQHVSGRIRTFVIADAATFRFAPVRRADGTRLDQSGRDREVIRVTGQFEYARSPALSLFVQAGHTTTRFTAPGRAPLGSDMIRLAAGLNVDLAQRARGTIAIGHVDRHYISGEHRGGLVAEGALELFPTQRLTLSAKARRSLEDATYGNRRPRPFWDDRLSAGVDYELLANLILTATADAARQMEIAAPNRRTIRRVGAGARYLVSRRITLDAAISHVVRDGTATAARETRGQTGLSFHL